MQILISVVAFMAFLAFAPQAAMKFAAWFLLTSVVVREAANRLVGAQASFGESAKSVVYAAILPMVALLGLASTSSATGINRVSGAAAVLVLALLLGSFVVAFMFALRTDLKGSAIVAAIAVAASAAMAMMISAVA